MRIRLVLLFSVLMLAACGGTTDEPPAVPTRVQLDSEASAEGQSPTDIAAGTTAEVATEPQIATANPTRVPRVTVAPPTAAANSTATRTATARPTNIIPPTATSSPVPTADSARSADASATASLLESPRFATLTPGGAVPATPVVAADVVITLEQLQEALDVQLMDSTTIESASLSFQPGEPGSVLVGLIAYGGQALTNGNVRISFELNDDFVLIRVADISVGSGQPPQRYVDVVNNELYPALIQAFDTILTERLGEEHDLQSLTITATAMEITLLVPQ
ncbi:MAG: hypothetical protein SF029_05815 [bacterium]|nr:hypothetical protein [bacterium]